MNKLSSVFSKDSEKSSELKKVIDVYKNTQEAKKKLSFLYEKEKRICNQKEELLNIISSNNEELVKLLDNKILLSGNDFYNFMKNNFDKLSSHDFSFFEKLFYNFLSKMPQRSNDDSLTDEVGEITSDGHILICPDPENCEIHRLNKKSLSKFKIKLKI
jgi:hypothetical protein